MGAPFFPLKSEVWASFCTFRFDLFSPPEAIWKHASARSGPPHDRAIDRASRRMAWDDAASCFTHYHSLGYLSFFCCDLLRLEHLWNWSDTVLREVLSPSSLNIFYGLLHLAPITSLTGYVRKITDLMEIRGNEKLLFRGHRKRSYDAIPLVLRLTPSDLLDVWEERAEILQFDAGMSRERVESEAARRLGLTCRHWCRARRKRTKSPKCRMLRSARTAALAR